MKYYKHENVDYLIGDAYQKDSGEVYKVSNRYYFPQDLFWCYTENCYKHFSKLKSANYTHGIVGPKKESGYFIREGRSFLVHVEMRQPKLEFMNEKVMNLHGYYLSPHNGRDIINEKIFADMYEKRLGGDYRLSRRYVESKHPYANYSAQIYSMKDYPKEILDSLEKKFESAFRTKKEKFKMLNYLLGKSIGIEFETSAGHLPENKCVELGLVPLKDGSISGHEYVTLPYRTKVVDRIVEACQQLRNYTTTDKYCSTHVHVGNLGRNDRLFIVALYDLWQRIQDEMYELIVVNKRSVDYINDKKGGPKDHCKPLPKINHTDINSYYKTIFQLFNASRSADSRFNRKSGVLAHSTAQKWNINCRYFNLNMIGLFENKGVIEFRIHGPTLNESKLVNYIFILNAIIEFAKKYPNIILHKKENLNLEKVISYVYSNRAPEVATRLINYCKYRKDQYFTNLLSGSTWGIEHLDLMIPEKHCILNLFDYEPFDEPFYLILTELEKKGYLRNNRSLEDQFIDELNNRRRVDFGPVEEENDEEEEDEDDRVPFEDDMENLEP